MNGKISSSKMLCAGGGVSPTSPDKWALHPWHSAPVVPGQRLGREIGFPTINVEPPALLAQIGHGVYVAQVRHEGTTYFAATHYGPRKTVADWRVTLEFHLLDFAQAQVAERIEFRLLTHIRDTMQFGSLAELRAQLARDVAVVRTWMNQTPLV